MDGTIGGRCQASYAIRVFSNNVTRHIDFSMYVDVCNNTMLCTHTPSQDKSAMTSTNFLSQRDSKLFCDEVHKDLNCNTFWSNHRVVKSPGDRHCFIYSAANSLSVNSSMPTPVDDLSVILKHLSDETVHNSDRYVDFIDGNGRGSLLQGLNEYIYIIKERLETYSGMESYLPNSDRHAASWIFSDGPTKPTGVVKLSI